MSRPTGSDHTCALANGGVQCWGLNGNLVCLIISTGQYPTADQGMNLIPALYEWV